MDTQELGKVETPSVEIFDPAEQPDNLTNGQVYFGPQPDATWGEEQLLAFYKLAHAAETQADDMIALMSQHKTVLRYRQGWALSLLREIYKPKGEWGDFCEKHGFKTMAVNRAIAVYQACADEKDAGSFDSLESLYAVKKIDGKGHAEAVQQRPESSKMGSMEADPRMDETTGLPLLPQAVLETTMEDADVKEGGDGGTPHAGAQNNQISPGRKAGGSKGSGKGAGTGPKATKAVIYDHASLRFVAPGLFELNLRADPNWLSVKTLDTEAVDQLFSDCADALTKNDEMKANKLPAQIEAAVASMDSSGAVSHESAYSVSADPT